jgi:hypothetical protein
MRDSKFISPAAPGLVVSFEHPDESVLNRASRKIFAFPAMAATAIVALVALTVRRRFNDPDLWWHLKTGEIIWRTRSIPSTDIFSFTTGHHAWTAHEWLSQVLIYGAWRLGGYSGLMVWLIAVASILLIAEYALCTFYSNNAKVGLLGVAVLWLFATYGLAIRPQLVGYLLLTCELLIVQFGRTRSPRWFLLLPPLFALWVNCHGSFVFGILVLAAVQICSFLDLRVGLFVSAPWEKRRRDTLAVAFALSIAALFLNPIGLRQVLYPLDALFNQPAGLALVSEWQPAAFDDPRGVALVLVAALILILAMARRSELRVDELLLLVMGFGLAQMHRRMFFVFGIVAAPILCRQLSKAWRGYDASKDLRTPNALMMALAAIVVMWAFPDRSQLELQVEKTSPVKAVEFIHRTGLSGRMLNEYVFGGYLIWAAPDHPVFVDGRADVYDWTGVLREYDKWETLSESPDLLLDKYQIKFCLLSRNSPMAQVMPLIPGWTKLYSDEVSVIFSRP